MKNIRPTSSDSEAVFRYIKDLNRAHRIKFTTLYKPGPNKKKPQFYLLYEALTKTEEFNEEQIRRVIPSKDYGKILQLLIEKLIYTQMFVEKDEKHRLYLIESALNLGAIEGVRKALKEELLTAFQTEQFENMLRMMGWVDAARRIYGIDLIPGLPDHFPSRRQVVDHLSLEMELSEILDACEIGFEYGFPHRGSLVQKINAVITKAKTFPYFPSRNCSYLMQRLHVRACLFAEQPEEALREQTLLLEDMLSRKTFSNGQIYQEVLLKLHLTAGRGRHQQAREGLGAMLELPADTPVEENLRFQFVQKAKVGLALYNWDLNDALQAYESIHQQPKLFRPHHMVDLLLKIATVLFVHGKMKQASRHLRELIQHPDVDRCGVRVWAELLLIASYHDRGEADLAHDAWKRARRVVQNAEVSYAEMVYRLLGKLLKTASLAEEVAFYKEEQMPFVEKLAQKQAAIALPLFDVLHWMEARSRQMSCFDLCQSGDPNWFWQGHFQELDLAGSLGSIVYPVGML